MKYIVVELVRQGASFELPFVFPEMFNHDEYYESVEHHILMKHDSDRPMGIKCVSAGFCNFFKSEPYCGGRSETLKIDSRPAIDNLLLQNFNYDQGLRM